VYSVVILAAAGGTMLRNEDYRRVEVLWADTVV